MKGHFDGSLQNLVSFFANENKLSVNEIRPTGKTLERNQKRKEMIPFVSYLIEANLGVCFFLLLYQFLLRKETDHGFKRFYLLLALLISVTLPFFHFQLPSLLTIDKDFTNLLAAWKFGLHR